MITRLTDSIEHRKSLWTALSLFALLLAGAALRFYQIGKQPLWLDEAFSVWMSWQPLPEIVRLAIDIDQHPPVYHFLLHFWTRLGGSSESWVRSLSALCGAFSILAVYFLGKTLGGRRVGLLAAVILTVSPFHVEYSQEARAYALLTLCASVSMWMTARLLTDSRTHSTRIGQQLADWFHQRQPAADGREAGASYQRQYHSGVPWLMARPERRGLPVVLRTDLTWLAYILFTALALYGHNTAMFLPMGINLFVLGLMLYRRFFPAQAWQLQAPSLINWVIAQVGVFLLWSPWLVAFTIQAKDVYGDFWILEPDLEMVLQVLKTFLMAHLPERIVWQDLVWAGFGFTFVLAWLHYRRRLGHFLFLAALFLVPFGGELLISLWQPIFYERTLIWATIPLYVLMAVGINRLRYRPYIATTVIMVVTLSLLSIHNYIAYTEKERWDQAAAYVSENARAGDIILFNAGWAQLPFDYYFSRYQHKVEEFGVPYTLFESGELEPRMTGADLPRLRAILDGRRRVWLIYSHHWWTDPDSLIPNTISEKLPLKETALFNGMQVHLYEVE